MPTNILRITLAAADRRPQFSFMRRLVDPIMSYDLNRKTVCWTIIIVAILCSVRFWFFYSAFLGDPGLIFDPDSQSYVVIANTLFESGRFGTYAADGTILTEFRRTPGYPIFLAGIFSLFGTGNFLAAIIVQHAAFFATVLIAAFLAFSLGGISALTFASAFLLLDFASFYFVNEIYTETLFTLFLTTAILLIYLGHSLARGGLTLILLAGTCLAVATMIRPASLYLMYVLGPIVALHYCFWADDRRGALIRLVLLTVPWCLIVGGWYVRNFAETGQVFFTQQEGVILLLRAQYMAAAINGVGLDEAMTIVTQKIANAESPLQAYISYFIGNPIAFVREALLSVGRTLFSPAQWYLQFYFPGVYKDLFPLESILLSGDFERLWTELARRPSAYFPIILAVLVHEVLLFTAFVVGVLHYRRLSPHTQGLLLASMVTVGYFLFMVLLFVGDSRFRVPFNPMLAVIAGYGVSALLMRRAKRRSV